MQKGYLVSLQNFYLEWLREVVPCHGGDELVLLLSQDGLDGRDADGNISARHQQIGVEDGSTQGYAHALHHCRCCCCQESIQNWHRQRVTEHTCSYAQH